MYDDADTALLIINGRPYIYCGINKKHNLLLNINIIK